MDTILIARQQTSIPDLVSAQWSDTDIPGLLDFDFILVEVPGSSAELEKLLPEIRSAQAGRACVVWLLTEESHPTVFAGLLNTQVHALRSSVLQRKYTVADEHFSPYFEYVPGYRHAFQLPRKWRSLATPRGGNGVIAAITTHRNGGVELVLPAPTAELENAIASVRAAVRRGSRRAKRKVRESTALTRLVQLVGIVLLVLVFSRYLQRHENRGILANRSQTISFSPYWNTLVPDYYAANANEIDLTEVTAQKAATDISPGSARSLLSFYSAAGFYEQELALLNFLSDSSGQRQPSSVMYHLEYIVFDDISRFVQQHRFELARFRAQRFLNAAYALGSGAFFEAHVEKLNVAQHVTDLLRTNYVHGDKPLVEFLLQVFEGVDSLHLPEYLIRDVDISLEDNVAYAQAVLANAQGDSAETFIDRSNRWVRFIEQHPQSELVEEAHFNIVTTHFLAFEDIDDAQALINENRHTLERAHNFAARFPLSHLADDALYYAVRLAYANRDSGAMLRVFTTLAQRHPTSDSYKRLLYRISDWADRRHPVIARPGLATVALVNAAARADPHTPLRRLLAAVASDNLKQDDLAWLCRRLLGLDRNAPMETLPVREFLPQLLLAWLEGTTLE